ncbi:hypothetical protein ACSVDA_12560 [Cytobacillus sp. Hm23]
MKNGLIFIILLEAEIEIRKLQQMILQHEDDIEGFFKHIRIIQYNLNTVTANLIENHIKEYITDAVKSKNSDNVVKEILHVVKHIKYSNFEDKIGK